MSKRGALVRHGVIGIAGYHTNGGDGGALIRGCRGWEGTFMNARMLAVALMLAAFASAGPARAGASGTAEQQRDCTSDAMTWCSQYIFAADRNARIGACLWQNRAQISKACYAHLRLGRR
jgi:hypothetical protein